VRRLSLANRDSGAESRVYISASAPAGRDGAAAEPARVRAPLGKVARDTPGIARDSLSWQVREVVGRTAVIDNMSVVDRQSARWYVKDIRASTRRWASNDLP
jgi:hypothetical protein